MNGFAQALRRRSDHLGFQLIKWNAQIVRDVDRSHKLAQVFEARGGCLQVGPRRQQALQLAGQFGVRYQLLRNGLGPGWVRVVAGTVIGIGLVMS